MLPEKINSPFKVPENYFEGLESQIMSQVKISQLNNLEKEPKVDYFKKLENEILSKTINSQKPNIFTSIFKNTKIALAASLMIVGSVGYMFWQQNAKPSFDNIEKEEIVAYLETEIDTETEINLETSAEEILIQK